MRSFIQELVHPEQSGNTECFNDYTEGSYHLNKMGLLEGIRTCQDSPLKNVEAIVVVGPSGPMWSFDIITILASTEHSDTVIVNRLVFTHARIRYKSTASVSRDEIDPILDDILSCKLWTEPSDHALTTEGDFDLAMALTKFDSTGYIGVLLSSSIDDTDESSIRLYEAVNGLVSSENSKTTYE